MVSSDAIGRSRTGHDPGSISIDDVEDELNSGNVRTESNHTSLIKICR